MQPTHLSPHISEAKNFREADSRLATSGQPTEQQLAAAAASGVEVVINLAPQDPRYSLADERASVEALGMTYVHIPVVFAAPKEEDLDAFFGAMDDHKERRVLIHCAANYRVSAFLGLYRIVRQGWSPDKAFDLMRTVWEPNECWRQFIAATLQKHRASAD